MAGTNSLSLVWNLLATDEASPVFERVGAAAESAAGKTEAASATMGGSLSTAAKAAGLAGAAFAAVSVKMAADFQQNMTRLVTTAGETAGPNGIGLVSKGILDMAGQVGIGANDLARGMYTVESAGIHGADALNVLKAAAEGARQEQADLGKTTDALTTILHDYNIPAAESADVMSKLVTAVSTGKTTLEDFTGALHSVTPLAAALHVPLADILGDLAAMTASGESADQATQNMADAMRHLQAPTAQMTAELAQVGITSQDLATDLSSKGLAGTMQEIEQAILQHVDPAVQRVLLPAFNESKTAAADLATMIGTMPPALAKLSQGLLDGSVAAGDYRKQVQGMGGQAGATGLQFLSLYKTSDGFNQILKQGGPAAQVFSAALQKAVGDSAGLTVALQLTGEHAASLNENIKKIGDSTAQTDGNIKGWAEVQGNFNQQLHETGAAVESLAIKFGTALLPALTEGLHFIGSTVIPGIEHLGSAVGDAAHWFSQLPGPVREMALALGGLALANHIGLITRLNSGLGALGGGFTSLRSSMAAVRDDMTVQQALYQMDARGAEELAAANAGTAASYTAVQRMMMGWDEALAQTAVEEDVATASTGRLSASLAALSVQGGAGLKSAGSGLMSLVGGGTGLGILGVVAGITALTSALHAQQQTIDDWSKAILDGSRDAEKFQQQQDSLVHASITGAGAASKYGAAWNDVAAWLHGYSSAASEANAKAKEQLDALTPLGRATQDLTKAENELQRVYADPNASHLAVVTAEDNVRRAKQGVTDQTDKQNDAEKTHLQLLQEESDKALAAVSSHLAAQQAQLELTQAIEQYNEDAASGQHTTDQLNLELNALAQESLAAAKATAQDAADTAKNNGVKDTAAVYNQTLLKTLQDLANHTSGPLHDSIMGMIKDLTGTMDQGKVTEAQLRDLGVTVTTLPDGHHITIDVPTQDQMERLAAMGLRVQTLPNGQIMINLDDNGARLKLNTLLSDYGSHTVIVPMRPGSPFATGGFVSGPGGPTDDMIPAMLSDGEFVVQASQTAKYRKMLEWINAGKSLREFPGDLIPQYAGGGYVEQSSPMQLPFNWHLDIDQASVDALRKGMEDLAHPAGFAAALAFAQAQDGKPYIWGGVGPDGFDCSGYMSAITNVINGTNPYQRVGTTYTFPWPGFADGIGGYFSIGSSMEHMAGTLLGVNVESTGDHVRLGSAASGAGDGQFFMRGHLPAYGLGTNYVPGDGPGWLHRGEAIVPAAANQGTPYRDQPVDVRVFIGERELTDIVRVETGGMMGDLATNALRR